MDNRLLSISVRVLRSLYGKTLCVNDVIKQTSRDRTYVTDVLDSMNKANLVIQGPREIGRKRPTKLTTLGNEIASILYDLDNFKNCYLDIVKFYRNNYVDIQDDVDDSVLNNILRSRKWEEDDIKTGRHSDLGAMFRSYRDLFIGRMLDIVHYRSLKIMNKYKINLQTKNNQIIQTIFEAILFDVINFVYGSFLAKGTTKDYRLEKELEINEWIKSKENWLLSPLGGFSEWRIPFFAMDELKKLLLSYLRLVAPDRDTIEEEIHKLQKMIEDRWEGVSAKGKKHIGTNCVLEVLKDQLNKS